MASRRTYRVTDVSRIARISVRTLHYYDEIGLLVPARRSDAGYRLYTDDDLLRLQQILIGRELGLPLDEIRRSLDDPRFDRRQALRTQRAELQLRVANASAMIAAVDAALAMLDREPPGDVTMAQIFEGFDSAKYEPEARERWGDTDAYRESSRRTKAYTADDWKRHAAEQAAIHAEAAAAMRAGQPPSHPDVMAIAERHRLLIDRWFYPCSTTVHRGLADMYESDSRFARSIERHGDGLAAFLIAAIRANADRTAAQG